MANSSVTHFQEVKAARQIQRNWQERFRQRMQGRTAESWRCVGVDVGKYEHVAVVTDGWDKLLCAPFRFSLYQDDCERFFAKVDHLSAGTGHPPLTAMEPTGHYYEPLANQASQRYGQAQVFLVQSHDVAERRKTWNKGTFKNDEVDACIIAQVLREGHGRPYRPPAGAYLTLYHLERYRLAQEQTATRLKNQIIGHLDRLYPGLLVRNREMAKTYHPLFRDIWTTETPQRLLQLFPNPYLLRTQTPESLYRCFREAGHWMNRPYAAKILAAIRGLSLPDPQVAAIRSRILQQDLCNLVSVEQQEAATQAEMVSHLDETWGFWLRPTQVDLATLASLVATVGDLHLYDSSRQIFGRSGLYSGCNDSGTRQRRGKGRHIIVPGDRHLRRQLMRFSFSMTARYPALQSHKTRLLQRGLSKVGAQIAIARRLTGVIFSVATKQEPFDPARFA